MSLMRKDEEEYGGLHIGAAPGTHKCLVNLILENIGPQSGVLDLGAHTGALILRMMNSGFSEMCAADLDNKSLAVEGVEHITADFNYDFSSDIKKRFSLITATEVIEHLDNPRRFLTNIHGLLSDNGYLALSFPNIGFWKGRIKMLLYGELWGFGAKHVKSMRHVSPITCEMIAMMLEETGFQIIAMKTAGSFATRLSWVLTFPLYFPIYILGGAHSLGESVVLLAKKTRPNEKLRIPQAYKDVWNT